MKNRLLAIATVSATTLIGTGADLNSSSLIGIGVGVLIVCAVVSCEGVGL